MQSNGIAVECSVMVCNYCPSWDKLRLTLKSILMQEDCNFEIVITDDGSEDNLFYEIQDFFYKQGFSKYKLVSSPNNNGTVYNVLQGLNACVGNLVRPASPGDFLHGKHVLRDWVDFMHAHTECIMSYCDAIYYHMENGKIVSTKEIAHPQYRNISSGEKVLRKYLLCGDICLGAASMFRRESWIKYLEMIAGKVIYAEDHSYRLMIYCGEQFAHVPRSFLLYEYGTGISTSGSSVWAERLNEDWKKANEIMLSMKPCDEAKRLNVQEFLKIEQKHGWMYRLLRWWICPSRILFSIRKKLFPNRTPTQVDKDFVQELLR
ncbi:glycosyltransferase family 2 protein [Selenomonas caprae]|uniref:Glycosyltransferase family 2 protein n=1 Tax=Selenomonas caprae TaxID=2606905 RepID=A0A5D6WUA1_9FIRM|nr:glycosyltransferase [Selenomonas caprae]TYZ29944.1 glycosyltransferase family 2 protein [Selenomonas caprae]